MQYNPKEIEKKVKTIWSAKKIPDKIVKFTGKKKFYLLDGPPYVNAAPHVGHVKTTTFKDVWGKFKKMQGFSVWFQPGFDCGGLPIENAVEIKLNIKSKQDIEKLGIDRFIEECSHLALGNETVWLDLYKKIGAWRGWLKPYLTSDNYYIESGWWTFKKIFEKGLLFKGKKPGFWCSHCETVLSGYEVTDSYKDLEDTSILIKFPIKDKKEFLLVFTTTPWTLPANVALCAHPDEIYVKVLVNNEKLILAEKRLEIFDQLAMSYKVLERFLGKKLDGLKYEPVLDIPLQKELKNAHKVLMSIPIMKKRVASKISFKKGITEKEEFDHLVTMDVGTGIVHIAPGHGESDNKLGKHYKLPEPSPVNEQGRLTEEAGEFSGYYVKEADLLIIERLREKNLLLYSGKIVHSYPLCWRCKTPLIYRMSEQWFLNIDSIRSSLIKESSNVRWLPGFASERFRNILLEAPDWAITRSRYWGIPIPIWVCEECGEKKVIGSIEELKKEAKLKKDISLHKNFVDRILLSCKCGSIMTREKDIMDVWFDSGISPWASLGYPFKNKGIFKKLWPVDLIDESSDQTRGWFYSLMVTGFSTFNEKPYNTVCLNGWTLDEKGEKMSKSLGNVVLATDAYNELGADVLRLYCCYDVSPWETQKFSFRNAKDLGRSLNILWNTYNFFRTYCKIDRKKTKLKIEDRWMLSMLNSLIKSTTENLESFNLNNVGRDIVNFIVNDFSRTYIKLVRDRKDKAVNYTLTTIFDTITRLMAPITPFISEYIYHEMNRQSVHLSEWPKPDEKRIDKDLEKDMLLIDDIVNNVNIMRKENKIKLRWPLPLLVVDSKIKNKESKEILKNMCNVKNVKFGKDKKLLKKKFQNGTVYLDTKIIRDEALLRELLREIQEQRKKNNLTVKDSIILYLDNDKMKKFSKEIKEKVCAKKIVFKKQEKILGKVLFNKDIVGFYFEKV
jgi:isoleucyl-tRNA synthetase